jgi:hypothetical protein
VSAAPYQRVAHDRLERVPYPVIQDAIAARWRAYGGQLWIESNGVGDPVIENLDAPAQPFVTTARSKVQAIQRLQLLLEQGRLKAEWTPQERRELLGAALLGAGMHLSRNLFAFGTVMNKAYEPWVGLRPPWGDFASFFGAQWASPVYGVIASSPVWFAVIALALLRSSIGFALPLCLSLFGLTWGFAGWISPTGGVNWGHRLIHPWLGAWLLLALWVFSGRTHRAELARVGAWIRSSGGRAILFAAGLLAAICAFVQYRALFGDELMLALFSPDSFSCPEGVISLGVSAHYSCLNYRFWSQVPVLVQAVNPIRAPLASLAALLCTGLFVWQGRQILARILGLPKRS